MSPIPFNSRYLRMRKQVYLILSILLVLSLACSLPVLSQPKPASSPTTPAVSIAAATATSGQAPVPTQPLPPALVESNPPPGSEIPLSKPITLYFNQSMDRSATEGALTGKPTLSGRFTWEGDNTLTFTPDAPFLPDTQVDVTIGTTARSKKGLALLNPMTLSYHTAGYLRLTQVLPQPDAKDVDPASAIVAAFNRPVVPLGADPSKLPAAFTIQSEQGQAPAGAGEWINTSTYIYHPKPALAGGMAYSVKIDPKLVGTDGTPLAPEKITQEISPTVPLSWSFTTSSPRLVSFQPEDNFFGAALDQVVVLNFNQSMDAASVAGNFALLDQNSKPVGGRLSWNTAFTTLTYTPTQQLARSSTYTVQLNAAAKAMGGTPLGVQHNTRFITVPDLSVYGSQPGPGGILKTFTPLSVSFSSDLPEKNIISFFNLAPQVANLSAYLDTDKKTVHLFGDFAPDTDYSLEVSGNLKDLWGQALGDPYSLSFHTGSLDPNLVFTQGTDIFFMTPQDKGLTAQVTNLSDIPLSFGSVPLEDFMVMVGPGGYDIRQTYHPTDLRSWDQPVDVPSNRATAVSVPVNPAGGELTPGLYYLRTGLDPQKIFAGPFLVVVSNIQITYKQSATDALVWAVDLRSGAPLANSPVKIYDESGHLLAGGLTGEDGVFKSGLPEQKDPYAITYAVVGVPGQESFGLALSTWNQGVAGWDFGIPTNLQQQALKVYIYTDRPVYRPGQTVFFRAIARQAHNGRYSMPAIKSLSLDVLNAEGQQIGSLDAPVSAYGTAHGQYTLDSGASPGYYRLSTQDSGVTFQVADYRKPEINLKVAFDSDQALAGQALAATVNARYFFDAPVSGAKVHWVLYAQPSGFRLPGYQVGPLDTGWLSLYPPMSFAPALGPVLVQGDAVTGADGLLHLQFPDESRQAGKGRSQFTLEVTTQDESNLPVSARAVVSVNPSTYYIGVRADSEVSRAGEPASFEVQVVDWDQKSAGARTLHADFEKVVWERQDAGLQSSYMGPVYVPRYTQVAGNEFSTAPQDGVARLQFTPPEPGAYQLSISGDNSQTQVLLWVAGEGQAVWPNLPNQRLRLVADRDGYKPGDTAQVFIPNPFGKPAQALITVDRSVVMRYQIASIAPGGVSFALPLSAEDAPNIFLSITLLGQDSQGHPDFRQGYLNLAVQPVEQALQVSLTSQPQRAGPGEPVTFGIRVTDPAGKPVKGEFSLSVVDLAALSLADPFAPDILPAFYGAQPLGVRTGFDLAVYTGRQLTVPGGMGGGGEAAPEPVVRENFPDTAYWNAEVVTGDNGEAQTTLNLPDTLTTWQVDVRGLNTQTQVGQAQTQVITTKDLLIRPAAPRFLVVNDHARLAAIVQNNTDNPLQVQASLLVNGLALDDPAQASQTVAVPAHGRLPLEWWGTVQDVPRVELTFQANAGNLQDAVKISSGGQAGLPVLHYTARQTFATSGTLDQEGGRLELVSLPRLFDPLGGELRLSLSPSIGGAMLQALDVLDRYPYECNEQTLSRFLPNLEAYRTFQTFGIESKDLRQRLDQNIQNGLNRLLARQNTDGGWGWWTGGESDSYITSYILFGLSRARLAGISVGDPAIQKAIAYLISSLPSPQMGMKPWELDRLAFELFALQQAGSGSPGNLSALNEVRDQLDPWAKALLALTLDQSTPGDPGASTLLSDIQSTAIRSATGVHWEDQQPGWQYMDTTITVSAIVVYALALHEPASTLLPDAVRFLMSNQQANGAWSSTYETAWTLMAMTEFMKGTGELNGNFTFSALLNGAPFASGQAQNPGTDINPVVASAPLNNLFPEDPNALEIKRDAGPGRLYYNAYLSVYQPVEKAAPLNQGVEISRSYFPSGSACPDGSCAAVHSAKVGDILNGVITLVLPNDAYHFIVEDYIPAGTELLDTSLKTTQQGAEPQNTLNYNPEKPFDQGWGWWLFHPSQIYDDHIAWAADHLPAGTYQLKYTLVVLQPGQYRVLPAHAWQFYFPEVQGNSAGAVFDIQPEK